MFKSSVFASMPLRLALAGVMAMLLSACALPPERPQAADSGLQLPASWKHAPAVAGWASAEQAADWAAGQWWRVFLDDTLDGLMGQLEQTNPGLQLAAANVAQAQAVLREQQAQRWPQLGAQLGQQRSGGEGRTASGSASLNLAASWAPDLWGRVALAVEAQQASVQASQADQAGVRLAAQASLAQAYLGLRATDAELELLEDVIAGYERAAEIARNRHAVGVAARTDAVQAEATLENALASRVALQRSRDAYEHAIAVLLGQAPAGFVLAEADWNTRVPALPAELPSLLLLRRPDLASAERAVAAANTRIGLARAAYFPDFNLSAGLGAGAPHLADLVSAPQLLWSLGLNLAQNLFDAGARDARYEQALAAHDAAQARYRQAGLTALKEVEDQLSALSTLERQAQHARAGAEAAAASEQQQINRYQVGLASYTEVVTAQASALTARRNLLQLQLQRQQATVSLVQALGGGWQQPWPVPPQPESADASRL